MNPTNYNLTPEQRENVAKLVAALRSGKFEQAHNQLRAGDRFCCLGVACEIYRRETSGGQWSGSYFHSENSSGHWLDLPAAVANWLGGCNSGFDVTIGGTEDSLANHNDHGRTFAEIADALEQQVLGGA